MKIPTLFIPEKVPDLTKYLKPVKEKISLDDLILKKGEYKYVEDSELGEFNYSFLSLVESKVSVKYDDCIVDVIKFTDGFLLEDNLSSIIEDLAEWGFNKISKFLFKDVYTIFIYGDGIILGDVYKKNFGFEEVEISWK